MNADPVHAARKASLRESLLAKRQAIPVARRHSLDALICGHALNALMAFDGPTQTIAAFQSHRGEPNLLPLCESLDASGRRVFWPVLADQALRFHQWQPEVSLVENRFGIGEPIDQAHVEIWELDWILLPLVGFSADGGRLGMGGGFYDRTLADRASWPRSPILAGMAYGLQQVDSIPHEAWDVAMDVIITERGALWVQ